MGDLDINVEINDITCCIHCVRSKHSEVESRHVDYCVFSHRLGHTDKGISLDLASISHIIFYPSLKSSPKNETSSLKLAIIPS